MNIDDFFTIVDKMQTMDEDSRDAIRTHLLAELEEDKKALKRYEKALRQWIKLKRKVQLQWRAYYNTFAFIRIFKKKPLSVDGLMELKPERHCFN